MCNSIKPLLPPEYQQVEYIRSAGNAAIWAGIDYINNNLTFEIEFEGRNNSGNVSILTTRYWGNPTGIYFGYFNGGYYQYGNNGANVSIPNNERFTFRVERNIVYRLNYTTGQYEQKATIAPNAFSANMSLYLFCENDQNSGLTNFTKGDLYRFKLLENSTYISDLIPCYRISDSVTGLYNLITRQFITATRGVLTPGPNV